MGKYDKYILEGAQPWFAAEGGFGPTIAHVDDTYIKGCHFYFINLDLQGSSQGNRCWSKFSHGPHIHKDAELIIHVGTNPDDPMTWERRSSYIWARRWRSMSSPRPVWSSYRQVLYTAPGPLREWTGPG